MQNIEHFKSIILEGVDAEWLNILNDDEYKPMDALVEVLEKIKPYINILEPPPKLMFDSLKYFQPKDTKFVLISQDPYPNDAMGLSFSKPITSTIPESLKNIYMALSNSGLIINKTTSKSADLRTWCLQGGLLLNISLSNISGKRGAHRDIWIGSQFTYKFISALCKYCSNINKRIIFILWGADAKKIKPYVENYHATLMWTHPSPMGDNRLPLQMRFKYCDHFMKVNNMLDRRIIWDPLAPSIIFIDANDAKFCIYIVKPSPISETIIYKEFNTKIADKIGLQSQSFTSKSDIIAIAQCVCLDIITKLHIYGDIQIISNSPETKNIEIINIRDHLLQSIKTKQRILFSTYSDITGNAKILIDHYSTKIYEIIKNNECIIETPIYLIETWFK